MFFIWIALFLLLPVLYHYARTIRHELTPGEPMLPGIFSRFLGHRELSLGIFNFYFIMGYFYFMSCIGSLIDGYDMVNKTDAVQAFSMERIWATIILLIVWVVLFLRIPSLRRWSKYLMLFLLLSGIWTYLGMIASIHEEFGSLYGQMTAKYQKMYDLHLMNAVWAMRVAIIMFALATFFWWRLPDSTYANGPASAFLKGRQEG